jgi:hypothetical protein
MIIKFDAQNQKERKRRKTYEREMSIETSKGSDTVIMNRVINRTS